MLLEGVLNVLQVLFPKQDQIPAQIVHLVNILLQLPLLAQIARSTPTQLITAPQFVKHVLLVSALVE
jgi:hypothetical protein